MRAAPGGRQAGARPRPQISPGDVAGESLRQFRALFPLDRDRSLGALEPDGIAGHLDLGLPARRRGHGAANDSEKASVPAAAKIVRRASGLQGFIKR